MLGGREQVAGYGDNDDDDDEAAAGGIGRGVDDDDDGTVSVLRSPQIINFTKRDFFAIF